MTRRRTLLAAITAGTAGVTGCLGILGGDGEEETGEQETIADSGSSPTPTAAPTTDVSTQETLEPATDGPGTDDGTSVDNTTEEPTVDFNVIANEVSSCGRTCRTLNYTVQNRGGGDASDVTVEFTVRSPDASGEVVFEGSQSVGNVDSQRQRDATTNFTFDESAANTIQSNSGNVVIEIRAFDSDGASETFAVVESFDVQTATPTPTPVDGIGYNVVLNELTKCGQTCRTMDYTTQNRGTDDATGVVAKIRVYTPDTDGEQVYDGEQDIGDLNAGTQRQSTKDVDTGLVDGRKIQDNDGDIDIRVNLSSNEDETAEFVFDEQLDV